MTDACAQCGLPVGRFGERREVDGVERAFCCYGCCLAYQMQRGSPGEPETATLLIRLAIGGFLAMNVMLFSLLLYADAFTGTDAALAVQLSWLLLVLATPLIAILGGPFLSGAWRAARERRLTADTLVSIGVLAAYCYSGWQVVSGSAHVYFDTAAMVLVLFTAGRYLEALGRARAMRSLLPMVAGERADVTVLRPDGREERRQVATVRPGDTVRIRPGERIGVDGLVVSGRSECDESVLTGQAVPRPKGPGDAVHAGSLNGSGQLVVQASVPGSDTRWVHIGRLVREALGRKSLLGETVDRVAARFVPFVLLLAVLTAGYWAIREGLGAALMTGLAVLVVACPCALGVAAPLATAMGIGQAARRGILIRGAGALEGLARVRGVAFDKTGTLTSGRLRVVAVDTAAATAAEVLCLGYALARGSEHPLARAIASHAAREGVAPPPAADARAHPGEGISGVVGGAPCLLGSAAFVTKRTGAMPASLDPASAPAGATPVYVGWDGRVRGRLILADRGRPEAPHVVSALRARGLRILLLSGDGQAAVAPLAQSLGIVDWHAALSPEAKVAILGDAARHGGVAMVGDGLNDGPVLAAATVGIALGDATDLAKESADVVMPDDGLVALPWLLELAQHVRASVRTNLLWAFGYNAVALTLAVSGLLQPVLAAALMAGSSAVIVFRSLRAARATARGSTSKGPSTKATEFRRLEA